MISDTDSVLWIGRIIKLWACFWGHDKLEWPLVYCVTCTCNCLMSFVTKCLIYEVQWKWTNNDNIEI